MKAQIKNTNGIPELVIDGDRRSRVWARLDAPPELAVEKLEFEYSHLSVDCFITGMRNIYSVCWDGADGYDYAPYEHHIEKLVTAKPDIKLVLFVGIACGAPYRWARAHREELALTQRGQAVKMPSMVSTIWRRDFDEALRRFVLHFENSRFADNILGYNLHRNCNECFGYDMSCGRADGDFVDYSAPMQAHFREWIRSRYEGDELRLRNAWKDEGLTFASIAVPSVAERFGGEAQSVFCCDDARGMRVADWNRCYNEANAQDLSLSCRALKLALREAGTEKLVGLMHGYLDASSGGGFPVEFGHLAGETTLKSEWIDFVHGPCTYFNRMAGLAGGNHLGRFADANWRRQGKYVIDQFDFGTHFTPQNVANGATQDMVLANMRRGVGHNLQTGSALYWYNGGPGNYDSASTHGPTPWGPLHYDDDCYRAELQRLSALVNRDQTQGSSPVTEIALIHSTESLCDLNLRDSRRVANLYNAHFRSVTMGSVGAPFDEWYLEDFASIDRPFKLYVFVTCFRVPEALRRVIRAKLSREKASALWLYGAGYIADDAGSVTNMEALTGIRMAKRDQFAHSTTDVVDFDHPYTAGLASGETWFGTEFDPQEIEQRCGFWKAPTDYRLKSHFHVTDAGARILAVRRDSAGDGMLASKEVDGFKSVVCMEAMLPAAIVRNILAAAGGHVYSNQGDLVYANSRYVTVCARGDGEHTLHLPQTSDLDDALSGERLATGVKSYSFVARNGETRIFILENPAT